jgi:hypothetical protein
MGIGSTLLRSQIFTIANSGDGGHNPRSEEWPEWTKCPAKRRESKPADIVGSA